MNISAPQDRSSLKEDFFAFATSPSYETETPFLISAEKMTNPQEAQGQQNPDSYKEQFDLSKRSNKEGLAKKEAPVDKQARNNSANISKQQEQVISTKQLKSQGNHQTDLRNTAEKSSSNVSQENSDTNTKNTEKLATNSNILKTTFFVPKQQIAQNERVKAPTQKTSTNGIDTALKPDRVLQAVTANKAQGQSANESIRIKEFSSSRELVQNFNKTETNQEQSNQQGSSNSQSDNKEENQRSFEKFIRQTAEVTNSANTEFSTQLKETEAEKVLSRTELSQTVLDQVERLRKAGNKNLRVTLQLPDGEKLGVRLNLNGQNVRVRFLTSSPEVRRSLEESWETLHQDAETRGVTIGSPEFEDDPLLTKSRSSKQPNAALQQFA